MRWEEKKVKNEIPSIVYDKVMKHKSQGTSYRNVSAKGTCLAKKINLGQENSWKVRVIKGRTKRSWKRWQRTNSVQPMRYLEVELFSRSTKSLKDIQGRVASIHVLRTEITLYKFMRLFLNPPFNFFSARRKNKILNLLSMYRKDFNCNSTSKANRCYI